MNSRTLNLPLSLCVEAGESGVFFVSSPEIKGLLVAKMSFEAALADVPRAIAELDAARADNRLAQDKFADVIAAQAPTQQG